VFGVVLGVVEAHDLGTLGVVHVVGVVVVLIEELVDGLGVVVAGGDGPVLDLEGGWLGARVLQK